MWYYKLDHYTIYCLCFAKRTPERSITGEMHFCQRNEC